MAEYKIVGTNEPYSGKVVQVGQDLFTTSGGSLEGKSYMVTEDNSNQGNANTLNNRNNTTSDVVTKFIVGVTSDSPFYHSTYSNQTYYFKNSSVVQDGTLLHHHSKPSQGQGNYMTQHSMDGPDPSVVVYTTMPSQINGLGVTGFGDDLGLDGYDPERRTAPAEDIGNQPQMRLGEEGEGFDDFNPDGGPANENQAPPAQTGGGGGMY